ncbi:MAG: ParB/RepB/Spo0J family partition protein [Alphaproteobacteria bacterium]|nr:ParB/RepB/Spo0J family partition protein [Alphaproteobacteria bacterium]
MTAAAEDTRKRGLGRGLSALFGEEGDMGGNAAYGGYSEPAVRTSKTVPIEFLRPNPSQPRKRFDEAAIDGLVDSIRQQGVLQPLLVRPHPDDANAYEIVAGERRWRAAQRAQLHEVPVVIKELSDSDTLEIALIENIHREDLTPLEEAEGYQRLIEEFGHTQDALSKAVGKSRSHVANMLRLLSLPEELKSLLDDGLISSGHARALLGAPNAEALAQDIVKKGLNVRQTEKLVQDSKPSASRTESGMRKLKGRIEGSAKTAEIASDASADKDPNTVAMERSLSDMLGMTVSIELKGGGESGRMSIAFENFDQLDDVIERLNRGGVPAKAEIVEM